MISFFNKITEKTPTLAFFSDDKLIKLNIDSSFPKYLLKNKKKFEHLIL